VSPQDPVADPLIGQTLDSRYQVEARIGRGGMGDVYLGRHLLLGSRVALKVLAGERAGDPNAARRFVREARSAFRVDHPHCVRVIDLGSSGAALYIAMEYLDGRTVGEELQVDGPIGSGRVAHIGAQVADALAHAHGLGLVHRDLKPENIMLVRRGPDPDFAKVLDFGLARIFDEQAELAGTAISISPLTRDGLVFGTPEYMSPEQASGGAVGPHSDVYALGAVLYHMVTGAVPFSGQTFTDILSRHVRETPLPPRARCPQLGIAPALERLILDCLEKAAARRPPGAHALGERLAALAAELGRGPARVPADTAASETADLDASQVRQAAAETRAAETLDLTSMAGGLAPASPAVTGAPVTASTTGLERSIRASARRRLLLLAFAAAALGAAIALAVGSRDSTGSEEPSGEVTSSTAPARPVTPARRPAAAAALPLPDPITQPPRPPAASSAAPDPAPNPVPSSSARGPVAAPSSRRSSNQVRADKHVRAAEAARRSGNYLLQLAEADEARRLDPGNRRAPLLVGEALVKSGDRTRGCPLLRRSVRLYREVGCAD
jgi:eukaryotic-like serine/threonine-protein kinase